MTLKFRTDIKKEKSTILEIKGKNRNYLSLFFPRKRFVDEKSGIKNR